MNDLEKYFRQNKKRLIHKCVHYFDIYESHFSRFRNKDIVVLEIGVSQGGSLQMWKNYFGEKAKIYGIDIEQRCKDFEEENIKILIGSQSDRNFLKEVRKQIPPIDILIDDGGHTMTQQILTFDELFSHVKDNGIYLCEDLCTSYWLEYGGGHKRQGTFIEYSKNFVDYLNAWHSEQKTLYVTDFTKSVDSLHYYDSMLIIEKKERSKPYTEMTGNATFKDIDEDGKLIKLKYSLWHAVLKLVNKFLRFFRLPGFVWK